MEQSLKIVCLMMDLQKAIEEAKQEHRCNEIKIAELHNQRTDAVHDIENCAEEDAIKRTLARCAFAERYAIVSKERREIINENVTLEYLIRNSRFISELNLIVEQMTGQMQFLDHAIYHPRSCGGGSPLSAAVQGDKG